MSPRHHRVSASCIRRQANGLGAQRRGETAQILAPRHHHVPTNGCVDETRRDKAPPWKKRSACNATAGDDDGLMMRDEGNSSQAPRGIREGIAIAAGIRASHTGDCSDRPTYKVLCMEAVKCVVGRCLPWKATGASLMSYCTGQLRRCSQKCLRCVTEHCIHIRLRWTWHHVWRIQMYVDVGNTYIHTYIPTLQALCIDRYPIRRSSTSMSANACASRFEQKARPTTKHSKCFASPQLAVALPRGQDTLALRKRDAVARLSRPVWDRVSPRGEALPTSALAVTAMLLLRSPRD